MSLCPSLSCLSLFGAGSAEDSVDALKRIDVLKFLAELCLSIRLTIRYGVVFNMFRGQLHWLHCAALPLHYLLRYLAVPGYAARHAGMTETWEWVASVCARN